MYKKAAMCARAFIIEIEMPRKDHAIKRTMFLNAATYSIVFI